jgi:hypothetical protein
MRLYRVESRAAGNKRVVFGGGAHELSESAEIGGVHSHAGSGATAFLLAEGVCGRVAGVVSTSRRCCCFLFVAVFVGCFAYTVFLAVRSYKIVL